MGGNSVELWTDGACRRGSGGWAFLLVHPHKRLERSGHVADTTNNRMEIQAVIEGLRALKRSAHVTLRSDSEYVGNGLTQWARKWQANGWRCGKKKRESVKNQDLWEALLAAAAQHTIEYRHVRGHNGNALNERVDQLAEAASQSER